MTTASPFHLARQREPTLGRFGSRTVLVDPPEDESPAVAPSREVQRESAIRSQASYGDALARGYRAWVDAGAPGFDPLEARDAAQECAHGRLPHDRTQVCRCWADDPTRTAPIPEEDPTVEAVAQTDTATAHETAEVSEQPAAPVRLRRDGRPDKRYIANGSTARSSSSARRRTQARTGAAAAAPENPTVARLVGELDREIDALARARAVLVEAA